MRNALLLVLICFSLHSCKSGINDKNKRNQDWVWWVDKATGKGKWIKFGTNNPVQNGTYTSFYYNGKIYEIGKLRDGVRVDTLYRFDINGQLDSYVINADSADNYDYYYYKNGLYERLFRDGKVFIKGVVQNHRAGDIWLINYDNGNVELNRYINNDSGYFFDYYENGKSKNKMWGNIKRENDSISLSNHNAFLVGHYFLIKGLYAEYFESGNIKDSMEVANGLANGIVFGWYDNGNIKARITYVNGKKDGLVCGYYENGKPELVCTAANDEIIGRYTLYNEDGKINLDTFFKMPIPVR